MIYSIHITRRFNLYVNSTVHRRIVMLSGRERRTGRFVGQWQGNHVYGVLCVDRCFERNLYSCIICERHHLSSSTPLLYLKNLCNYYDFLYSIRCLQFLLPNFRIRYCKPISAADEHFKLHALVCLHSFILRCLTVYLELNILSRIANILLATSWHFGNGSNQFSSIDF